MAPRGPRCLALAQLAALALALSVGACTNVVPRDAKGNDLRAWDPPVTGLAWSGASLVARLGCDGLVDKRWPMEGFATRYVSVDLASGEVRTFGSRPDRVVRAVYLGHPVRCRISCDLAGACSVAAPAMPGGCPPPRAMAVACGDGRVVTACDHHVYVYRNAWRQVRAWRFWPWNIEISGARAYLRCDEGEFGGCLGVIDLATLKTRCLTLAEDGEHRRISTLVAAPDGSLWVAEGGAGRVAVYRVHSGIVTRELPTALRRASHVRRIIGILPGAYAVTVLTDPGAFVKRGGQWTWIHVPEGALLPGACITSGRFAGDIVVGTWNDGIEVWDPFFGARTGHVRLRH